ncbi:beta-N-acetylhexosaminidase [soil metagenome]
MNITRLSTALLASTTIAACGSAGTPPRTVVPVPIERVPHALIPAPAHVQLAPADSFIIDSATAIVVDAGVPEAARIGRYLALLIGTTPAWTPRVIERPAAAPDAGAAAPDAGIHLSIDAGAASFGDEGYELTVTPQRVTIRAHRAAGLFYGVQTLRQLMPARVEYAAALPRPLKVPATSITDAPRYAWRGAMLDVSRHFFGVADVKRVIELMALYKLNRLHLHLSDDQGWRIEILSWPNLTAHGGSTQVGGRGGGFFTQDDYAELVRHAQEHFITIVPEIDMPGHTNAALASYAELNCDGVAPPLYTGIRVGFSTLCVERDVTYRFVDDVVREIAALTPGAWFHIGGDEVQRLTSEQYQLFIERVQEIVRRHGKHPIGWTEIAPAKLLPETIVQHWRPGPRHFGGVTDAVRRGARVILSPADRVYLDMKYDSATALGLTWAGVIDVRQAYDWDPATYIDGVPASAIIGVEAPLWSETVTTIRDIEFLAFPRLSAVAEIGWSPAERRDLNDFRARLAAHSLRWTALGVNFYRSSLVDWSR